MFSQANNCAFCGLKTVALFNGLNCLLVSVSTAPPDEDATEQVEVNFALNTHCFAANSRVSLVSPSPAVCNIKVYSGSCRLQLAASKSFVHGSIPGGVRDLNYSLNTSNKMS